MMKFFSDVFAWSYEDLKEYDAFIIQHTILVKPGEKTFRQKLKRINPMLLPLIEKEVKKLFNAKIIVTLKFSKLVENLVPIRKKNDEIILCVDFRNLNKVSLEDHYSFPQMDHILQKVVGAERISIMSGFQDTIK